MQMEQYDKETCTLEEQKAQSADPLKVLNVAHPGGVVYAPILYNVQGAKCITFEQSVAGANVPEGATRDFSSLLTEYKESIISRHEYTREYNSSAGEQVPLKDRYIEPLIIQRHRVKKEREKEIRSKGNRFFNLSTFDTNQSIFTCNLFGKVDGKTTECTKAVILQGNSGNGKSFIAQKVILDWAKGDLFAGIFDVVFYLRCSELNCISEDISLLELLNCSEEMTPFLKDKQKRVLFLVDGFDEFKGSLSEKTLLAKVDIRAKPGAILSSLLKGNMLKDSFLLVTTRSTATEQLGKLLKCPHRFTEIMGFSEKGVQEYFQMSFQDQQLSTQVYEHVKTNHVLHTACSSPAMCWLICDVFKQKCNMGTSMKIQDMKSTTSIFIDFVFTLMEHHCQDLDEAQKFMLLKGLCQLAVKGMLKGKFIFEKHDVPEVILNLASLPFLCTFKHKNGTRTKEMFTFMHLSFQEFFAALFYVLLNKSEAQTEIKKMLSSDLFKTSKHLHLLPVIQFLFGLSNKNETDFIHEKYKHVVPREIGSFLKNWMREFVKTDDVDRLGEFILKCLYEVNKRSVVKKVMNIWESGSPERRLSFSRMADYQAVVYCLEYCKRIRSLDLKAIAMQYLKMMETALSKCDNLHLGVTYVTDDDVADLISVLGKEKNLRRLRMDDGSLSDHSVQEIITYLSRQKSVGDIHLSVKAINYNITEMIMDFQKCPKAARNFSLKAAPEEESLCSEFSISTDNGDSQSYSEESSSSSNSSDEAESGDENDSSQSDSEEGSSCSNSGDEAESSSQIYPEEGSICSNSGDEAESSSQSDSDESSSSSDSSDEAESKWFFQVFQASNSDTNPFFTYISLSMSEPEMNWRGFFQSCYETKWLNNGDPDFGEKTDALLSFLHGLPGLLEVEFQVHTLTASWAQRILIFFCENANIRRIGLLLDCDEESDEDSACKEPDEDSACKEPDEDSACKESDEDSACTSLTFKRNFTDGMVAVKIHTLQDDTVPSCVYIKLPCSEFCNLDVAGLLYRLECLEGLNDNTQEHEVQINELISFLHSVPRLHVLKLWIENLTISWATWILSFTKCHSLTEISVKSVSSSFVMEEAAISELEKKWTSKECVVVIKGIRCSNTTDKCSMQDCQQTCNNKVTLSFCGGRSIVYEPLIPEEREEMS